MRSRVRGVAGVVVSLLALVSATASTRRVPQDAPASGLTDGMQLVYASNGQTGTPNVVDSVRRAGVRGGATCAIVFMGGTAGRSAPEPAHYCARGDTLFLRDSVSDTWSPQRPIGVRMTIDFVRPNGNRVRYSTDTTSRATIGDRSFTVVHTTVLTMDSTGRPMRRLTERYAPALVTAVGGRFETADSSAVGGWRETQLFELRAIREVGRR